MHSIQTLQAYNNILTITYLTLALPVGLRTSTDALGATTSGLCTLHGTQTQPAVWEPVEPVQTTVTL